MIHKTMTAVGTFIFALVGLVGWVFRPSRPVLRRDILLIAPFDEDKAAMGNVLMETLGGDGGAFDENTRVQPLANRAALYNLPGFYTPAGGETRARLGLPAFNSVHSTKNLMNTEMPIMENAVALVVLDPTMTPIPKDELQADIPLLKEALGKRVRFVFINHDKFRSWSPAAQRKREKIWQEILGDTHAYYCETQTRQGIPAIVDAINKVK